MLKRCIMAAVGKVKPPISLERPPSATMVGHKTQIRAFQTNSSPVYKTQSESNLTDKMKGLTIKDKQVPKPRRAFGTSSTGAIGPVKSLDDVANLLKKEECKNVVVVAGAGISTPSGIPDFRSPGTGLYDNLQQYRIPYPEAIFDIEYFHHNPKPFYTLAKELYPSGKYRPNYIHYFVRLLHDKGLLLRMYTQNIDGLERLAGVPPEKLVEAHGTFATATCTICGHHHDGPDIKKPIFEDKLPKCKRRGCTGIVKPDIVFFGEDLPKKFYFYLKDMLQTDLVVIMGTSLEVQPFAGIVDVVRWSVPRVLFNMSAVGPFRTAKRAKDVVAAGDMIKSMQNFSELIGWKEEMVELITKHEGRFRVCDPDYTKNVEKMKHMTKNVPEKPPTIQNAFWRRRADTFYGADSDSSSEESESDITSSECSSDDDDKPKRRRKPKLGNIWRPPIRKANATPTKNGMTNGVDSAKKGGGKSNGGHQTRNYSTDTTQVTSRTDKSVTSNSSKVSTSRHKASTPNSIASSNGASGKTDKTPHAQTNGTSSVSQKMAERIRKTTSEPMFRSNSKGNGDNKNKVLVQRPTSERSGRSSKFSTTRTYNPKSNTLKNDLPPNSVVISRVPPSYRESKSTANEGNQAKSDSDSKENQSTAADKSTKPPRQAKPQSTQLNAVNTRPYGYSGAQQRKLLGRPSAANGFSNMVNKNSDLAFMQRLFNSRPGSAELPKISYRHRLQPVYDARIFALRVADTDSSSEASDDSDSDDCR